MKIPGYSIKHQIGQGGMAMVYYAIQESLGRPVALKIMNPLLADHPEFSQRFLNEGRLLAALQHNNIITIYDIGVSEQCHYISMEYVDGGDLKQRILRGLSPMTALDYAITLGHCLKAAHDLHVVHRDIKPVNILFRRDDTLLLTDFGVAKNLESIKELTTMGSMVGSPYYLSPEQALGRAIDGRADIYSLGIVFYEMLVGERPFQGDSAIEIAMQHINNTPPPLPQHLSPFQPLLDMMTAKDPQNRFPHAASFLTTAQQVREAALPHEASLTVGSRPPGGPPPHPAAPYVSPSVDGTGLEKTVLLHEAETTTTTGKDWTAAAAGHGVTPPARTLTPAKIWLLAGVASGLALAGMLASGGLADFKGTPIPLTVSPGPSIPTTDAAPTGPISQATPATEAARTAEATPPADAISPVLSADSLPPAAPVDHRAAAGQALDLPAATDSEPPAVALHTPDSMPAVDRGQPAPAAALATHTAQIEQWLLAAQAALADDRLMSPAADNAAYYYQNVQALEPTHPQVTQGWQLIAQRYYELTQQAMDKKHIAKAQQHVQSGLRFQSDHAGLLSLHDTLQQNDTRRSRPRIAQPRPRSPGPSASSPDRSGQGFFQGVKNLFKASPGGSQEPRRERSSSSNE